MPILYRVREKASRLADAFRQHRAVKAVEAFPRVLEKRSHGLPNPLTVTLTSYPKRFPTLALTLMSLLDQKIKADRVVLWIAHQDLAQLPDAVRQLERHGLEIRGCEDIRSYKKLIFSIQTWPDNYLITADDDVYYPKDWLSSLVECAKKHPGAVVATRGHLAQSAPDGRFEPYRTWVYDTAARKAPSELQRLVPTGVGGILYPPDVFAKEVVEAETFMRLCPTADDIWFFWMSRMHGADQVRTARRFKVIHWDGSQEDALWKTNVFEDGNDQQIRAMEEQFGSVR